MNLCLTCRAVAVTAVAVMISHASSAQTRVVNMIPQARSIESFQDSEPTLAIDPNNYNQMAGSTFTPVSTRSIKLNPVIKTPIFVSADLRGNNVGRPISSDRRHHF